MPTPLSSVHAGDPITDKIWNALVSRINRAFKIRSDGTIDVKEGPFGIVLSAKRVPQSWWFKLTQDTPDNQGYVTVRPLRWIDANSNYGTLSTDDEIKVYDRLINLSFDNVTDNKNRAPSEWTKAGFVGRAEWAADRGQWQIAQIEHVARWINFELTEALALASTTVQGTVLNYWDGLSPTANGESITLLTSPTSNYQASDGAKGIAVWRNDLDNSSEWQYQILDLATDCPTT